ncbi:MAG TPA: pilin [Patescibacteria group bacterium]|nr:pilin [Patescibacteria group bacterium]
MQQGMSIFKKHSMRRQYSILILLLIILFFPSIAIHAQATPTPVAATATPAAATPDAGTGPGSTTVITPAASPTVTDLPNPLGETKTPAGVIRNIIKVFLSILGAIAFFFFVYGGFLFLISAGNQDRIKKGRETLVWATVGLIFIFSSYGIAAAVFKILSGA